MIIFFKFFPMVPPMKFFFILWYPKGSKKNWPKCHSGQSVSGQSVTLAKVSLAKVSLWPKCHWPKCHQPKWHWPNCLSSQTVSGQSVSGQKVTLAKVSFWPKCPGQSVSGQSVILAKLWFSLFYRQRHLQNWVHFFVEKKIKTSAEGIVTKNLRSINSWTSL